MPLTLPRSDDPEEIGRSEAVVLFAERARRAVPGFVLGRQDTPLAEQAAAWLLKASDQDRELAALRWLDAEDATLIRALGWALDHDPGLALRLAAALAPWLRLRGRIAEAHEWLCAVLARTALTDQGWAKAQLWLGHLLSASTDLAAAIDCFTAVIEAHLSRVPSRELVGALVGRTVVRLNAGEDPATVHDARRALELAREVGCQPGELEALTGLSLRHATWRTSQP